MAGKSVDELVNSWTTGMGSAATKYKAGIARVLASGKNPMAMAAAPEALARYRANTAQAGQEGGRMANALNSASPQQWGQNAQTIGANRLADGATKGKAKYQKAMQKWSPIYQQASAAAHALPKGGLENAMARVRAVVHLFMQQAGKAA